MNCFSGQLLLLCSNSMLKFKVKSDNHNIAIWVIKTAAAKKCYASFPTSANTVQNKNVFI